jgi:type IV pilus assembly protein PilV
MVKLSCHRAPSTSLALQRGITMIEVLVSIVVISLGLLGFAGLQAVSIKANNTAYQRGMATVFAYDIIDRMRANRPAAINGSYNFALGAGACAANLVGTDICEFLTDVGNGLPGGIAGVTVAGDGFSTIVIQWTGQDDLNGDGIPDPVKFTTQTKI